MSQVGSVPPRSRFTRLRVSLLVVIALSVLALLVAFLPRYRRNVTTVDNTHQWAAGNAPPRHEIVWQPATEIEIDAERGAAHSRIRPQLADDGRYLYFTIRTAENDLQIVRSIRSTTGWSTPQPIEELNSPQDDIGPVISQDGSKLYLYSNRAGGFGGMDLYVSQRDGEGWTKPVNLGETVNSPAHEYDPAVTPDGDRLYFASNRDQQTADPDRSHWTTTLRSDPGKRTFDLFAADFDAVNDQWKSPEPLNWLNTRQHNEGSPYVTADGAFLYFASDRPMLRGEEKNYDLFRVRLGGERSPPQNLGSSINTAANEIEPAASSAGFQLHFSRGQIDSGSEYALFQSTAKEVYRDTEWEQARVWSLGTMLANGVKSIFDRFWLILLILAALASLYWLIRQIRFRHVAVPSFLLLAVVLHLCFVAGSFFVFFQQSIAKRLRELLEQEVVATQVLSSTVAKTTEQSMLETVANLEMPAPIEPAKISRQTTEYSEPQPIELAKPQPITAALSADRPNQPVVATVMIPEEPPSRREPLQRASKPLPQPIEQIELMKTVAAENPQAKPVEAEPVELARRPISQPDQLVEPIELKTRPIESALQKTDPSRLEPTQRSETDIEVAPAQLALPRSSSEPQRNTDDTDTPLPAEQIAAAESSTLSPPPTQVTQLPRSPEMLLPTLRQPEPLELRRDTEHVASPLGAESLVPMVASADVGGNAEAESVASPLSRSAATNPPEETQSDVPTESIMIVDNEPGTLVLPEGAPKIEMSRQDLAQQSMEVEALAVTPESSSPADIVADDVALTPMPQLPRADINRDPLTLGALARRPPSRSRFYADASVRLQNLLMRRKLDEATKIDVIKEFGGNDQTLAAIRRGLSWIEQHQHRDGHWSLHEFHTNCQGHQQCSGRGSSRSDTAGTALALLPFLGDGNTHQDGPYKDLVAGGITWLVKNQKPDGNLFTGGEGNAFMYSHGIATIALCECYGMTGDQSLRDPAQRAINFIVAAQDPKSGGWRYRPRQSADTSVVGWQVMALKSGQMAALNVPAKTLQDAQRWLDSVAGKNSRLGQFSYQRNNNFNPAMTAEAILCLEYLDNERESESLTRGSEFLLKNLPAKNRETSYYWYYGTQSMFHLQGEPWRRWNEAIHPLLVQTQQKTGPLVGTWDPRDQWERSGGRIYATSLRILMLEVYYRHLPLYQVVE